MPYDSPGLRIIIMSLSDDEYKENHILSKFRIIPFQEKRRELPKETKKSRKTNFHQMLSFQEVLGWVKKETKGSDYLKHVKNKQTQNYQELLGWLL
jgi:hypothetical protein